MTTKTTEPTRDALVNTILSTLSDDELEGVMLDIINGAKSRGIVAARIHTRASVQQAYAEYCDTGDCPPLDAGQIAQVLEKMQGRIDLIPAPGYLLDAIWEVAS